MKLHHFPIAMVLAGALAQAHPEIRGLSIVHREQSQKTQTKMDDELKAPVAKYLAKLKDADQKATRRGELAEVEVLKKEIGAVEKGLHLQNAPKGLPGTIERARGRFIRDVNDIKGDYAERQAELDKKYFKAMGDLLSEHASDQELAAAVEKEKERVLAGAFGEITDLRTQIAGTSWINSDKPEDIRTFEPGGKMSHWRYEVTDRDIVIIHWNENRAAKMVLARDGKSMISGDEVWELYFPREE